MASQNEGEADIGTVLDLYFKASLNFLISVNAYDELVDNLSEMLSEKSLYEDLNLEEIRDLQAKWTRYTIDAATSRYLLGDVIYNFGRIIAPDDEPNINSIVDVDVDGLAKRSLKQVQIAQQLFLSVLPRAANGIQLAEARERLTDIFALTGEG